MLADVLTPPLESRIEPRFTGTVDAITVDNAGAARLLGISESHFYALKRTGRLGPAPIRLGRCCRYLVSELGAWCEAGCPARSRWQAMSGK